jgi:DNA helicase IV
MMRPSSLAQRHPDHDREQAYIDYAHDCVEEMAAQAERMPRGATNSKVAVALERLSKAQLAKLGDPDAVVIGRIDPVEENPLYVGRFTVFDGPNVVVSSWQAEAARPFYSATPQNPMGLIRRRTFETDGRKLVQIFEEHLAELLPGEPAPSEEPSIDDLLLRELERERSDRMRDIVRTIREDQYRLISAPLDGVLAIQGAPGTGKTVVGLHRASWLLFNHREQLQTSQVLVVGPNRIFMRYIADVLPSLGESAVDQSAVQYLVAGLRAREDETPDVGRVKGDPRMASVVARAIWDRIRLPDGPVEAGGVGQSVVVGADDVAEIARAARQESSTYMGARRVFASRLRQRFHAAALAAGRPTTSFEDFTLQLNQAGFASLLERIWPSLSAQQAVRDLLGSRDRLQRGAAGVLSPEELSLLYRQNPDREEDVKWTEHDIALVDEAQSVLNGIDETYGHVIVDEAQDLTPMQLRMVGRRARRPSLTLLGDLAQATGIWAYRSWEEIAGLIGHGSATVEELVHVYRVPEEVMALAAGVLDAIDLPITKPVAFRSAGSEPEFREVTRPFLGDEIALAAALASEKGGTAAIIAPESMLADVRKALDELRTDYRDGAHGELGGGIELLTPRLAKGLEFDHVVLAEPLAILREANRGAELRELYVALTRPTKSLMVLHSDPLPSVVGGPLEFVPELVDAPTQEQLLPAEAEPRTGRVPAGAESPRLSARLSDALAYARLLGGRDAETAKAVERGLAVAGLLLEAQAAEEEAIAALLRPVVGHDVDDAVSDVRRLFGPSVADALARSINEPDESPVVLADALRVALVEALAERGVEHVIGELREMGRSEGSA